MARRHATITRSHAHAHTHTRTHTHIRTRAHTHTCTHTYRHTCTYTLACARACTNTPYPLVPYQAVEHGLEALSELSDAVDRDVATQDVIGPAWRVVVGRGSKRTVSTTIRRTNSKHSNSSKACVHASIFQFHEIGTGVDKARLGKLHRVLDPVYVCE